MIIPVASGFHRLLSVALPDVSSHCRSSCFRCGTKKRSSAPCATSRNRWRWCITADRRLRSRAAFGSAVRPAITIPNAARPASRASVWPNSDQNRRRGTRVFIGSEWRHSSLTSQSEHRYWGRLVYRCPRDCGRLFLLYLRISRSKGSSGSSCRPWLASRDVVRRSGADRSVRFSSGSVVSCRPRYYWPCCCSHFSLSYLQITRPNCNVTRSSRSSCGSPAIVHTRFFFYSKSCSNDAALHLNLHGEPIHISHFSFFTLVQFDLIIGAHLWNYSKTRWSWSYFSLFFTL